jgi:hypothetical protein
MFYCMFPIILSRVVFFVLYGKGMELSASVEGIVFLVVTLVVSFLYVIFN